MDSSIHRTDVLIIGAGPAGITAAVQLRRMGINFVLIEKHKPGGLIRNANFIENYPGFPSGITGEKFTALISKQLANHDVDCMLGEVQSVDFLENRFNVEISGTTIQCDYLIIASGTKPNPAKDIEIEDSARELILTEIHYVYDLEQVKNNIQPDFAIIGSGDAAFDYALNLSRHGLNASIFIRGERSKALPLLIGRACEDRCRNYIHLNYNHKLLSINKHLENEFGKITLKLIFDNEGKEIEQHCNYLLFAIGRQANLDFLTPSFIPKIAELEKEKRLFFAGDVKNKNDRQLSIAVGDAMKAAMTIYHDLCFDR